MVASPGNLVWTPVGAPNPIAGRCGTCPAQPHSHLQIIPPPRLPGLKSNPSGQSPPLVAPSPAWPELLSRAAAAHRLGRSNTSSSRLLYCTIYDPCETPAIGEFPQLLRAKLRRRPKGFPRAFPEVVAGSGQVVWLAKWSLYSSAWTANRINWAVLLRLSFCRIFALCTATVLALKCNCRAISLGVLPWPMS